MYAARTSGVDMFPDDGLYSVEPIKFFSCSSCSPKGPFIHIVCIMPAGPGYLLEAYIDPETL